MKIDNSLAYPENVGPQKVGTTGPSPSQNQSDKVSLATDEANFSIDGDKVQQLTSNLTAVPDVRQERVAALTQAINQGSYNVSNQQIAEAMGSDSLGKA